MMLIHIEDCTRLLIVCQVNRWYGKIIGCMNTQLKMKLPTPPKLTSTIAAGFNAITNHIWLILLPVALDLLLWFGPHLQVKSLLQPLIEQTPLAFNELNSPQFEQAMSAGQQAWQILADRINLLMFLRTFPIGLFSLMFGHAPIQNPLGTPVMIEVTSPTQVVFLWLLLSLIGILIGSVFFASVSKAALKSKETLSFGVVGWYTLQALLLTVMLIVLVIGISLPVSCIISLLALISPSIAQIILLIGGTLMVWFLAPFIFAPHGIFTFHYNIWHSIQTSIRLVRYTLPATGLFIISAFILNPGLDLLWGAAPENSWMSLVGIFGHAFISTSLLAASFIYYRDVLQWLQEMMQLKLEKAAEVQPQSDFTDESR